MHISQGSAARFFYVQEVAGAIPANPIWTPIRFNSASLARTTSQVDSSEINSLRQRPVSKQGTFSLAGEIAAELSHTSFDELMQAALQGTWATNVLKIGSTLRTFAILKRITDGTPVDYVFRGCCISTMAVSAQLDARVTMNFGVIGMSAEVLATLPTGSTFGTMATTEPMVTSVGSLNEGGAVLASMTAFDLTLDNGMAPLHSLFNRAAIDVQNGVAVVSGSLSAYRDGTALYNKHLNETTTSLVAVFSDGTNTRTFTVPRAIYTQADDPVSGPGAIIIAYTYSAGYDAASVTTLQVARSA